MDPGPWASDARDQRPADNLASRPTEKASQSARGSPWRKRKADPRSPNGSLREETLDGGSSWAGWVDTCLPRAPARERLGKRRPWEGEEGWALVGGWLAAVAICAHQLPWLLAGYTA